MIVYFTVGLNRNYIRLERFYEDKTVFGCLSPFALGTHVSLETSV